MAEAFIIHGSYGSPEENWFPWLKEELEKLGLRVFVPRFPTPEGQSMENWMEVFNIHIRDVDENTILVGHGTGAVFILDVLETLDKPVFGALLVAGFLGRLNIPDLDPINSSFSEQEFNFPKIKQNAKNIILYRSDSDPIVHIDNSVSLEKWLKIRPKIVEGAGHFNEEAGYTRFELLLEDIKFLAAQIEKKAF